VRRSRLDPREDSASVRFDEYRSATRCSSTTRASPCRLASSPTVFGNWVRTPRLVGEPADQCTVALRKRHDHRRPRGASLAI
jgi:hypothetical protein